MYGPFEEETALDLIVNVVPLAIMVFFLVLFVVMDPWEFDPFVVAVSLGLLFVPIALLALLSYVAGLVIQRDERSEGSQAE